MQKMIFVHGIANRSGDYEKTFQILCDEVEKREPKTVELIPCNWSDTYGGRLPEKIRSIPTQTGVANSTMLPSEVENSIWALLETDPTCEIVELDAFPIKQPPFANLSTYKTLLEKLLDANDQQFQTILADLDLDINRISKAINQLSQIGVYNKMVNLQSFSQEVSQMLARAIIAQALIQLVDEKGIDSWPRYSDRTRASEGIAARIFTASKFIGSKLVSRIAQSIGTNIVRTNRQTLTRMIMPVIGDVLVYQQRGEKIRDLIENVIMQHSEEVTILAHSLGGVACVDLLIQKRLGNVKQLITVGSQAGFFSELGILQGKTATLPEHFPNWLNIYDPNDFLSYLAKPIFTSEKSVIEDVVVESGEGFPTSHSAYFTNENAWKNILAKLCPQRGGGK